ncbi:MAG: hypothetical protein KDI19_04725 [Pseudomonadales bacterium]|nr:hypothetical protein [Pseudomonadales bacterium]
MAWAALCFAVFPGTAQADPRADYLLHCAGCHLPNGKGAPPDVPSLVGTLGLIVASPEGRAYVLRVPGASQAPLDDESLANVMNWVLRTFNEKTLPKDFRPLEAAEATDARRRVLADPVSYRKRLWPDYD